MTSHQGLALQEFSMQIKQLSSLLDTKVAELDARVILREKTLSQSQGTEEKVQIQQELDELARLREKLIRSKELAWEVHSMERKSNKQLNQRKALIGLILCMTGGLLAVVLLAILLGNFIGAQ
jgi:small-conductance mechanosensitive channel